MLQSRAVDLVNALVLTLKDHRQESFFDKLSDEALNICEQCDSATTSVAKREKMLSSRLSGYGTLSTVGQREAERDKDMFCTSIQSLSPQSDAFLKESNVFSFGRLYNADNEDLGHELHQFKRVLDRKIQSGEVNNAMQYS